MDFTDKSTVALSILPSESETWPRSLLGNAAYQWQKPLGFVSRPSANNFFGAWGVLHVRSRPQKVVGAKVSNENQRVSTRRRLEAAVELGGLHRCMGLRAPRRLPTLHRCSLFFRGRRRQRAPSAGPGRRGQTRLRSRHGTALLSKPARHACKRERIGQLELAALNRRRDSRSPR